MVAKFSACISRGLARIIGFAEDILAGEVLDLPDIANDVIHNLCAHLMALHARVRLRTISGVGAVTASAIIASIGDGHQFRNGREFAAWLGLTSANKSSGGKEKLGRMTKMGDQYIRSLLVVGMRSLVRQTNSHLGRESKWLTSLLERKPARVTTVAMANKTTRIVWAVLTRNELNTPPKRTRNNVLARPATLAASAYSDLPSDNADLAAQLRPQRLTAPCGIPAGELADSCNLV